MPTILTKDTLMPLGLVITLIGAALSFGVMYGEVRGLDRRMARVEDKLDALLLSRTAIWTTNSATGSSSSDKSEASLLVSSAGSSPSAYSTSQ